MKSLFLICFEYYMYCTILYNVTNGLFSTNPIIVIWLSMYKHIGQRLVHKHDCKTTVNTYTAEVLLQNESSNTIVWTNKTNRHEDKHKVDRYLCKQSDI